MKTIRLWFATLAFALVASIIAVPAGPAQAGGDGRLCFPVHDQRGRIIDWICVPDLNLTDRPRPEPCRCPDSYIDILRDVVLPVDDQTRFVTATAQGLELLAVAAGTEDRDRAEDLRRTALREFAVAVEALRDQQARVYEVGVVNIERNEFSPQPDPWLESAGANLVEGLELVRVGALDEAAGAFDRALEQLAG